MKVGSGDRAVAIGTDHIIRVLFNYKKGRLMRKKDGEYSETVFRFLQL